MRRSPKILWIDSPQFSSYGVFNNLIHVQCLKKSHECIYPPKFGYELVATKYHETVGNIKIK